MKLVLVVAVFALALAALGVACGPEEPYCYEQHKTCAQAKIERDQAEIDRINMENAAKDASAGPDDAGATVIDH